MPKERADTGDVCLHCDHHNKPKGVFEFCSRCMHSLLQGRENCDCHNCMAERAMRAERYRSMRKV